MDEGLHLLNAACEKGQRTCQNANQEVKLKVQGQVTELKADWEKLNQDINSVSGCLEGAMIKFSQLDDLQVTLNSWMSDMENELKLGVEPKAEINEKKAQIEKYKVRIKSDSAQFM